MASRGLVLSLAAALLLAAPLAASQGDGTATVAAAPQEWLDGDLRVRLPTLEQAEVEGRFDVHQVVFQGAPRSAQALREAYRQATMFGAEGAFVAGVEAALHDRLEASLQSLFPALEAEVASVTVDEASLKAADTASPFHPPLRVAFEASVAQDLGHASLPDGRPVDAALLRTALELGAVARLPHALVAQPGWNITYTFEAPTWARLAEASGATLGADGATATWTLRNWRGSLPQRLPVALEVHARSAPPSLEASDVRLELLVDLAGIEGLTLPGLLAQDFGQLLVHFDARIVARSLRLEDFPVLEAAVADRLPSGLALQGLSADGVRLAMQRGLLPASALDAVEQQFRRLAEERVAAFGASADVLRGGFEPGTLEATGQPLVYRVAATFRLPLATDAEPSRMSALAAAGPVLLERALTFDLPRLQGLDTTYRVVLPPGIALSDVHVEDGRATQEKQDGRDVLVVTPEGDEAQATLTIAVTAGFVLAQFWYVWAFSLFLGALGLAFRWLRRRPKKPAQVESPKAAATPLAVAPAAAASPRAESKTSD